MVTQQVYEPEMIQGLADWLGATFPEDELRAMQERYVIVGWPKEYTNAETNKTYNPHHKAEQQLQYTDGPRHLFVAGGEGGGKSVFGIIKDLNRLRRGMSGAMVSPDLEHFKKSLWPEFKRWCPWEKVIERHRYRSQDGWEPSKAFTLVFNNDIGTTSSLICGGCKETQIKSWEGPNINFAHMDEMRRHTTPMALKTFLGRVRIPGPNKEPPQLYITSTPLKHWLYEYFGPMECKCQKCSTEYEWKLVFKTLPRCPNCKSTSFHTEDIWRDFKLRSAVIRLRTEDNEPNLQANFASERALSLTEAEARVLLDAEWEDIEDAERFLPSILLWDLCKSNTIPPLSKKEPMVLGVDAAKGRKNSYSDCFAIVGVTRHWERDKRRDYVAVRFVQTWQARPGKKISWVGTPGAPGPETVMRQLCKDYNIVQITYDPSELHDLGMRLTRERVAWMKEFSQMSKRIESDTDLIHLVASRRIIHGGDATLREHLGNADRKVSGEGSKLRMVKRLENLKIDAAVALSMAAYQILKLKVGY
jgi:hypothetical protein